MLMILGVIHLDAIDSIDADLPLVPAKRQIRQRKPLKVVTELLQCRCGFTKGTIIKRAAKAVPELITSLSEPLRQFLRTSLTGPIRQFLNSS